MKWIDKSLDVQVFTGPNDIEKSVLEIKMLK